MVNDSDAVTTSAPSRVAGGLAVYDLGAGPPVLAMPGPHRFSRVGLRSFDALTDGFVGLGKRVLTFDPPGSGASTRTAHLSMEEMHDSADETLAICEVGTPVDVVGHSMGGLAALAFTIERPERVQRLILIGTGSGGPAYARAHGALWNRSHPQFPRLAALGILHVLWPGRGPERVLRNFIDRSSFVDPNNVRPRAVTVKDWFRPREGRSDWQRVAKTLDYSRRLGEIAVHTLILCGRHDPQYPPASSDELAREIPQAELVWFERSGHYPQIEEPEAFWSAVGQFLASTDPADLPVRD